MGEKRGRMRCRERSKLCCCVTCGRNGTTNLPPNRSDSESDQTHAPYPQDGFTAIRWLERSISSRGHDRIRDLEILTPVRCTRKLHFWRSDMALQVPPTRRRGSQRPTLERQSREKVLRQPVQRIRRVRSQTLQIRQRT